MDSPQKQFLENIMNTNRIKFIAMGLFILPMVMVAVFRTTPVTVSASPFDDPATIYKAKCAMCHGQKAEKFYDPAKPDAEQVEAILKGKKGEKPPYMPAFEPKGITEDDAKALVTFMKGLKTTN
jgi:mono/diheme cytochrome c family protein